jgi:heme/copper-type cytochrome/quinol oxidase subunit 2
MATIPLFVTAVLMICILIVATARWDKWRFLRQNEIQSTDLNARLLTELTTVAIVVLGIFIAFVISVKL